MRSVILSELRYRLVGVGLYGLFTVYMRPACGLFLWCPFSILPSISARDVCLYVCDICGWYMRVACLKSLSVISACDVLLRYWCACDVSCEVCLRYCVCDVYDIWLWCLPIGFCLFTCDKCLFWLSVTSVISVCDVCNVSRVYEVSDNLWYLIIPDVK
jgi:hypothetical protein